MLVLGCVISLTYATRYPLYCQAYSGVTSQPKVQMTVRMLLHSMYRVNSFELTHAARSVDLMWSRAYAKVCGATVLDSGIGQPSIQSVHGSTTFANGGVTYLQVPLDYPPYLTLF